MAVRYRPVFGVVAAAWSLAAGAATLAAQAQAQASNASHAPRAWVLERTPDGRPDFQGVWANNTVTPLQRPEQSGTTASLAPINVIMSGGFSAAFRAVLPEFERTSGIKVTTTGGASQGNGPNTIGAQLRRGVPADVVILSREGLDDLIAEGRIVAGTDVDLAQTPIGMAVRAGAPKPDISTVDAFKQTLRHAKSVTFSSSTTGIYLTTKLFPRLGIADELAGKSTTSGVAAVAKGDAEIALQPVSELLPVPGVDFVGTIPTEIQYVSVFSAAVVAGSKEPEASKRLIAFLTSANATTAIQKNGMEPAKPRN